MRADLQIIEKWISPGSHVLDLGCGNGELLHYLQSQKKVRGYGLEIDPDNINTCINKGVNVIENNLDHGLDNFADRSFDTVVMTQALQAVHYPDRILEDMLRIGREAILTFPNFG
ncbi:MAG: methyltransferase domain-containing protein, partial [Pseudomonas formosensis]|nr:methyltransferase domain-containing protein [Halopseudomonas formosensis]